MDVSNSPQRPHHRGGGGPKQNEIVGYLKKYAKNYKCSFVESAEEADVFFTNDVFPDFVLKTTKRKIKRMDGIFWNPVYAYRNIKYNEAALQADHVIFISEYAKNTYFTLYGVPLKKYSVILNKADTNIYKPKPLATGLFTWIAIATDWSREEKRLQSIVGLMYQYAMDDLYLIGKTEHLFDSSSNTISFGYIDEPNIIIGLLQRSNAMINFSYRDPAPKVVAQAVACGLPILYADSGGTQELVGSGIGLKDYQNIIFETNVPLLNLEDAKEKASFLIKNYKEFKQNALEALKNYGFNEMLDGFFKILLDK